jgi:hypothetical protein
MIPFVFSAGLVIGLLLGSLIGLHFAGVQKK